MTLAQLVDRYGRAIALAVALAAGAGIVAGVALPSSIYPSLEFPRVVIIGHSGTLPAQTMMLSVTRPLEQAVMEVPGIRRVRSTTFRGATEISAQFEPVDRHDRRPAAGAGEGRRRAAGSAGGHRSRRRAAHAGGVSDVHPESHRLRARRGSVRLRLLRHAPAACARRWRGPGCGRVERHPRNRSRDRPGAAARSRADRARCGGAAEGGQPACAGRAVLFRRSAAAGTRIWPVALDCGDRPDAGRRSGPTACSASRMSRQVFPGAPDRTGLITGNGRDAASISVSQQVGANILEIEAGVEQAVDELARALPAGLHITKVYDLAEFVRASIANVRDAILIGGFLAVIILLAVPSRLAADARSPRSRCRLPS